LTEPIDNDVIDAVTEDTAAAGTGLTGESATEPIEAPAGELADSAESAESAQSDEPAAAAPNARLVQEGDIAADYLEGLLDIADLDGDIDMDVEGDRAAVSIAGGDLGHLVGRNGEVLDALQELTRLAVLRETGERSRLMLDIEGHRARRRVELTQIGTEAADRSKSTGEPISLAAMTPFERKIVHDAVAAAGLVSESEGVEPMRYVVVRPA
jgi:spoIIIJ-associated protein